MQIRSQVNTESGKMEEYNAFNEKCRRCGKEGCDGLTNCTICGEDANCTDELCHNCQQQKEIDEYNGDYPQPTASDFL